MTAPPFATAPVVAVKCGSLWRYIAKNRPKPKAIGKFAAEFIEMVGRILHRTSEGTEGRSRWISSTRCSIGRLNLKFVERNMAIIIALFGNLKFLFIKVAGIKFYSHNSYNLFF